MNFNFIVFNVNFYLLFTIRMERFRVSSVFSPCQLWKQAFKCHIVTTLSSRWFLSQRSGVSPSPMYRGCCVARQQQQQPSISRDIDWQPIISRAGAASHVWTSDQVLSGPGNKPSLRLKFQRRRSLVGAFILEEALVGAFTVIVNLRGPSFQL